MIATMEVCKEFQDEPRGKKRTLRNLEWKLEGGVSLPSESKRRLDSLPGKPPSL